MINSTPTPQTDSNGTIRWHLNGKLHRAEGPAIEWANGTKEWYLNGGRHRADGPAIESPDGGKAWWVNGNRHRTDGPATGWADGLKEWWVDGKQHRIDGPAVGRADGTRRWCVNGEQLSTPYTHVLTAVFNRGIPIPEGAMLEIVKATSAAQTQDTFPPKVEIGP